MQLLRLTDLFLQIAALVKKVAGHTELGTPVADSIEEEQDIPVLTLYLVGNQYSYFS